MNAGISGPNLQIWICIRIEDMVRIPSQMATTILLRCGMVGWAGLTGPWSWKIDLLAAADLFSLHLAENLERQDKKWQCIGQQARITAYRNIQKAERRDE